MMHYYSFGVFVKYLSLLFVSQLTVFAFSLVPSAEITSNYVHRGISWSNNAPALQGGVLAKIGNFYTVLRKSDVAFDANNTLFMNDKRLGSSDELSLLVGYSLPMSGARANVGVIDYRYNQNGSYESNISQEYFASIALMTLLTPKIRFTYDAIAQSDPMVAELILKSAGNFPTYTYFGWYPQSGDFFSAVQFTFPLEYLGLRGMFAVEFASFQKDDGMSQNNTSFSYRF